MLKSCSTDRNKATSMTAARHRVLYIIDRLNHTMGGAEGALAKLSRAMPQRGYDCSVACFSAGNET
jgi:hypothetical protein